MIDPFDPLTLGPARKAAKLTQTALADLAGVSQTTVMRIEKGEVMPTVGTWAMICRALPRKQRGFK